MARLFKSQVHICLVGALVLSLGVSSAVMNLFRLIVGKAEFHFGFLLIFIGLGLLRGSALQRSIFGGLLALSLVGLAVLNFGSLAANLFSASGLGLIDSLMGVLFFLGGIYCFVVLWDAGNNSWFREKYGTKAPPFVIPVAVVLSLLLTLVFELANYRQEKAMSEFFRYNVEFVVRDRETGELIEQLRTGWRSHDFSDTEVPEWMTLSGSSSGRPGETSAGVSGYSRRAVKITLSKKGYADVSVEVDGETGSRLEIPMTPLAK